MEHTIAAEAIYCKKVALSAGTLIGAQQIDTVMFTTTSIIHTLIDIYIDSKTHDHKIMALPSIQSIIMDKKYLVSTSLLRL